MAASGRRIRQIGAFFFHTLANRGASTTRVAAGPRRKPDGWVVGKLTGAQAVAETLKAEGVGCVFGIPGAQENEIWDEFKALSGWTRNRPPGWSEDNPGDFTRVEKYGETWWYETDSPKDPNFVSDYAKSHPLDDFAESFAAYFLWRAGLAWYNAGPGELGAAGSPEKYTLIDGWVRSLSPT